MKKAVMLVALLFSLPVVYAQLDWAVTDLRCGNDVLDQLELCEKGVEEGFCDELADLLKIDTACDTAHCTCLPRVNKVYCGNNIREGVEVCDGSGEDLCPEYGRLINMSLTCNKSTCGCSLNGTVPSDYNPIVVEQLINASQTPSVCGDKKVERDEDCDPPNTLCTTNKNEPGVCTEKCRCVEPELLGVEETPEIAQNITQNVTENVTVNVSEVEVVENVTEVEEAEEPGFFGRLWAWIVGLFS